MKKSFILFFVLAMSISLLSACTASEQPTIVGGEAKKVDVMTVITDGQVKKQVVATVTAGEDLFKWHCAICHLEGRNIVNPQKTLHKAVREKNGIKTAKDIIKLMRNPGPGMSTFDETDIPDKAPKEIAEYILKTF